MTALTKQNVTAWFFEGGSISIPNRMLGMMEQLHLSFDDIGKIIYLLYCGADQIKRSDKYAVEAARTLHEKGLIHWFTDTETVDFSPMFDKMSASLLGNEPLYVTEEAAKYTTSQLNYAQLIKKLEQTLGLFLTMRDKQNIQEAVQRYNWSYDLVYEIFVKHYRDHRKEYDFGFFCRMAYGANVRDEASFQNFAQDLDTVTSKMTAVLRKLGQKNSYPSEPEKELYRKWFYEWKFSHELIMLAVEETVGAQNRLQYMDTVLSDWREQGITTAELVMQKKQRQVKEKADKKQTSKEKKLIVKHKFQSDDLDLSFLEE